MAKTRISISLDPGDAELIKAVAAENGLDVSAFLVMAGRKEAVRLARLAESFAEIDAAIAAAEAEAEELVWPPDDEVDEDEIARAQAEIAAARAESAVRRRGAVA
ncbi:hypothetical protein [Streptomyces regalis]|uniref:CopG family transcriptional regulator n=1 Tax=Streptomyces regalis TaxID=68262 RepID=A0A0X3UWI7_9ACTN|nr:hypothetical protein [Streptomyces regalis]KUL36202.1 hypothetical protein ADL12_19550 [Streptomyces regalis]